MPIPSRGIGWSTTENLLWQISKQLEGISCQLCDLNNNFTTTTTTTTAVPFYIFELANDNSAETSCASLPATETYYSDINDIGIGTYLYYDSALTNPVDDGWYASPYSGFTYEVSTGDGMINNAAPC